MVVEDDNGIVGYAAAALDACQFYTKVRMAWFPDMCQKYPLPTPPPTASEKFAAVQVRRLYILISKNFVNLFVMFFINIYLLQELNSMLNVLCSFYKDTF